MLERAKHYRIPANVFVVSIVDPEEAPIFAADTDRFITLRFHDLDPEWPVDPEREDRKSTRLNSSHSQISYAVFCLKKKKQQIPMRESACTIGQWKPILKEHLHIIAVLMATMIHGHSLPDHVINDHMATIYMLDIID